MSSDTPQQGVREIPPVLVRLAGFLAERSVDEISLTTLDGERLLQSRRFDLPGELSRAARGGATIRVASLGLEISVRAHDSHLSWRCNDTALTLDLAKALSA